MSRSTRQFLSADAMRAYLCKLHPLGILALATSLVGIVSDPAVMGFIPHPWSMRVALAGALLQSITRAVHKGDVQEVKKG